MWIGAADHELSKNIVHLVLARTDGAAVGTRGLSLFIVPKFIVDTDSSPVRNDVAVAGLNDEMGQRGIANAALNFGDGTYRPYGRPGAVAWIVGEPGAGLEQMFHMMNEARISVGLCAASIGSSGYLHALEYRVSVNRAERWTGRRPHPRCRS